MAKKLTDEKPEIDREQLKRDLQMAMAGREKVASANQDHGKRMKAIEEKGYHKAAFNSLLSLAKKSPEYLADWLRTFYAGIEVIEEMAASNTTPDMLDEADADSANGNGKRKTKEKVTDLAKARRERETEPVH